ncbi:hypothetical protein DRO69_10605 [Candidatus Bathyarchaeota archaeon]|nr:MAG: hypothetical protein DRO69_10605 [Candidatus Bathyarchaeota archaeon]
MPVPMLHTLANRYEIEVPFDAPDIYTIIESFLDELSLKDKKVILSQYGDAGRVSSFIFVSREKTPPIQTVFRKTKALLDYKPESLLWEHYPYIDDVMVDHITRSLRIRFHYLYGSVLLIDEKTGRPKEHRREWRGVVIYRPKSRILEVRTKYRSMARKMSVRIPAYLGLEPFVTLNLMDEKMNRKFVDWITSLNSATIELPISEVSGSLRITARKGMDLRTAKRYHEELKYGRLRHGHVTIERNKGHKVNFHIYFRDCHKKYTLFTSEEDIEYVVNALEKISEGYVFAKPEKILTEYFSKKS